MAVIIEELEATIDPQPEPSSPPQQESGERVASKELSSAKFRAELSRLSQREMRLRAD